MTRCPLPRVPPLEKERGWGFPWWQPHPQIHSAKLEVCRRGATDSLMTTIEERDGSGWGTEGGGLAWAEAMKLLRLPGMSC